MWEKCCCYVLATCAKNFFLSNTFTVPSPIFLCSTIAWSTLSRVFQSGKRKPQPFSRRMQCKTLTTSQHSFLGWCRKKDNTVLVWDFSVCRILFLEGLPHNFPYNPLFFSEIEFGCGYYLSKTVNNFLACILYVNTTDTFINSYLLLPQTLKDL